MMIIREALRTLYLSCVTSISLVSSRNTTPGGGGRGGREDVHVFVYLPTHRTRPLDEKQKAVSYYQCPPSATCSGLSHY